MGHPKITSKMGIGQSKRNRPTFDPSIPLSLHKPWEKPKNDPIQRVGDRQKWINGLRAVLKPVVLKIYEVNGGIGHIPGCQAPSHLAETVDLDEIKGRHLPGSGPLPGALDPENFQALRRCCHMRKTAQGHVDYRTRGVIADLRNYREHIMAELTDGSQEAITKAIRKGTKNFLATYGTSN